MNTSLSLTIKHHLIWVLFVLAFVATFATGQVISSKAQSPNSTTETAKAIPTLSNTLTPEVNTCHPGAGWTWARGSSQPEIAVQVEQTLNQAGIEALVEIRSYGESDSCGAFRLFALDFAVTVKGNQQIGRSEQQQLAKRMYPILARFAKPKLGQVKITFPQGITIFLDDILIASKLQGYTSISASTSSEIFNKKVYVLVFDPLLSNRQQLSVYMNWSNHANLTQETIDFFKRVTDNRLQYMVVYTTVVTDGWPEKIDGFRYTEAQYLAVINGQSQPHIPDNVDYNKIINSPQFDICGKLNRGEIDELWIYNGPYFGFYESRLVGPGTYWYNSPPVSGPTDCNRLLPIMGPSVERGLAEAIHNFGHRTESTMMHVYGSWEQNRTAHNWDRFALVEAQSPNYYYSGCGSIHYPPNGLIDYDYMNPSTVLSNCGDFINYPNLGEPSAVALNVTCSSWDCIEVGYYTYWFGHLPSNTECGADHIANDWWKYFANPVLALNPSSKCQLFRLFTPMVLRF